MKSSTADRPGTEHLHDRGTDRLLGAIADAEPAPKPINWAIGPEDLKLIHEITRRARDVGHLRGRPLVDNLLHLEMDLVACHLNGCPLDLKALLNFRLVDFVHDLLGIHRHLSTTDGSLGGQFLPRCARDQGGAL